MRGAAQRLDSRWLRTPRSNMASQCSIGSPGIVHQEIESSLLALDAFEQRCQLARAAVVTTHGDALAARCRDLIGVSSMLPGSSESFESSMIRPYVVAGCARVLRPVTYTVAPASPSSTAMPRPAPRLAPVMTATWPASRRCSSFFSGELRPAG